MHVEAVVVHLHVIFALAEIKQGHIPLTSLSHSVSYVTNYYGILVKKC